MAICAVDFATQSYSVVDRPNASDDFGEYLASQGTCDTIVTFSNVYDQPVTGNDVKKCQLRILSTN